MSLLEGIIVWFDQCQGYGFVRKPDGNDMFVHTKLMPKNGGMSPGDRVQFKASNRHNGLAMSVKVIGHKDEARCV